MCIKAAVADALFYGLINLMKTGKATFADLALFNGLLNSAFGLMQVLAIAELTVTKVRVELDKTCRQLLLAHMPQAELTNAW